MALIPRGQLPGYVPGTPEALDAVAAAPENHSVVFENERVRVLRVLVRAGEVEKKHTHRWPSVFTITTRPRIKYFGETGEEVDLGPPPEECMPFWLEAEGIHWLENHDTYAIDASRVEIKT